MRNKIYSSRLVFDMQACQSAESGKRGIGRYSNDLIENCIALKGDQDVYLYSNPQLPHALNRHGVSAKHVLEYPDFQNWRELADVGAGERSAVMSEVTSALYARLNADVVHISNVFESDPAIVLPSPHARPPGQVYSATLYDLIPLVFSDHYFQNAAFRDWYRDRVNYLRSFDLLLSISESTRQDAIERLGIPGDRIVTINGGISDFFKPVEDREGWKEALRRKFDIQTSRFVLYTGGDEFRKNLPGAIQAFAALPDHLRSDCTLVIVCNFADGRREIFRDIARREGLQDSQICLPGYVTNEELVAFYSVCDLFFFPSNYEGLGLPVLEAMACGAPVIGANNSSIAEIIQKPDALFNERDPKDVARVMSGVLSEPGMAQSLRDHGRQRTRAYTWRESANTALEAMEEAKARKQIHGRHAIASGWLPKLRVAIHGPVLPDRSGIADYAAQLLPFLSRYNQIDLFHEREDEVEVGVEGVSAYHHSEFPERADDYDAIVYEFGNSEFHAFMLPHLRKFPGIVRLHDGFLSGLYWWIDQQLNENGRYKSEMVKCHAARARRIFAPSYRVAEPIGDSMLQLPCTKSVLDDALGVLVHSRSNIDMAKEHYPENWAAPFQVVPLLRQSAAEVSPAYRQSLRAARGFSDDDILICSFGHITWTKLGDRIVEAFLRSTLEADPRFKLVFAGELARDHFGQTLRERIEASGYADRIIITGFLDREEYLEMLQIADLAVQLRTLSRGETSGAALDCLAFGVPLVITDIGSFKDFPDDVTLKVSEGSPTDEIQAVFDRLDRDFAFFRTLGKKGLAYLRDVHDPERCAQQITAAIHEFTGRHAAGRVETVLEQPAAQALAKGRHAFEFRHRIHSLLEQIDTTFEKRAIYIDVSHIAEEDLKTGIQRVVREIATAAFCRNSSDLDICPVELIDGKLYQANRWLDANGVLSDFERAQEPSAISFNRGDHLVMLDSSWQRYEEFLPVFRKARDAGASVSTVVYDLLPIRLRESFVPGGSEWFEGWLRLAIAHSDNLITISKAVADDLARFIEENGLAKPGMKLGWWHLGSTPPSTDVVEPSDLVRDIQGRPFILMVGTIEPRKNHALALDIFDEMWRAGQDASLVIVGKQGWMVEETIERIRHHPELGRRLYWVERASDSDLFHLYRSASFLMFLSKGEGFGLPLVEASYHNTPILCSDIPVFREVAKTHANYLDLDEEPARLASRVIIQLERLSRGVDMQSKALERLSWEESMEQLISVIQLNKWSHRF